MLRAKAKEKWERSSDRGTHLYLSSAPCSSRSRGGSSITGNPILELCGEWDSAICKCETILSTCSSLLVFIHSREVEDLKSCATDGDHREGRKAGEGSDSMMFYAENGSRQPDRANSLAHLAPQFEPISPRPHLSIPLFYFVYADLKRLYLPLRYIVKPYSWEWRDTLINQPHPGAVPLPFWTP
jgi:hypothetical protein